MLFGEVVATELMGQMVPRDTFPCFNFWVCLLGPLRGPADIGSAPLHRRTFRQELKARSGRDVAQVVQPKINN